MPEYLAPGVVVEEVSFRQKTIEGVSTSTTGFVGPARFGPLDGEPEILTSFSDFERIYGGLDRLDFVDHGDRSHNFLAQAVRAYFEEGGKRLYVARVFEPVGDGDPTLTSGRWSDGRARWRDEAASPPAFDLVARYPGAAGNFMVTFVFRLSENIRGSEDGIGVLRGALPYDVVWAVPVGSPAGSGELYWVERYFDETLARETWRLRTDGSGDLPGSPAPPSVDAFTDVRVLTVSVIGGRMGRFSSEQAWQNLSFHPDHRASLFRLFDAHPSARSVELYVPLVLQPAAGLDTTNAVAVAEALLAQPSLANTSPRTTLRAALEAGELSGENARFQVELAGGNDGNLPDSGEYLGREDAVTGRKSGLTAFQDLEDVSILAAPGSTFDYAGDLDSTRESQADPITRLLISHCERMRYRIAVLDSINGQLPSEVREMRATLDSTRAALYYPWVRVFDPITEQPIFLPPSGHVCGIYARNDTERGVHKAPANEVVRLALGFELLLNHAQQETLNPEGINCLRYFEGRGFRVWGARTASSDPEWKYVNVRRYFAFLERSIEKGTQWAVFENNGPELWANVQQTVADFLFNEWKSNHLLGLKPEQAFFVRCDRSTMSQNDLDNGRLICLVGVSPLRPAEFVIFRIGQKTADARA